MGRTFAGSRADANSDVWIIDAGQDLDAPRLQTTTAIFQIFSIVTPRPATDCLVTVSGNKIIPWKFL